MWHIQIDTGGTFTDCMAQSPTGVVSRVKVLSSSFLRGNLLQKIAPFTFEFSANWAFDTRTLVGFDFRLVGHLTYGKVVQVEANVLQVSEDFELNQAADFELTTHEEAPVLATRLVTNTPVGAVFPVLTMRLGTTKGTNALLERKGAAVTLFVTKGFKDLLRIGTQQRPHLFQLAIPEPTLLYQRVIEIEERITATGEVLTPLLLPKEPQNQGESVAVSLLNSYANPQHEQQLAENLSQHCSHVSSGVALYAGVNYLKRTQTALVNAYLQPILSQYLQNIRQSLGGRFEAQIWVMNSAGGLVNASHFNAKDSLLSGPAGGMVGAATVAQQLGFRQCLTFDMGGTSTDTARFDGKLDWRFVTKIEDIELHNPTLAIETVAAGGGSICAFDGQKITVGPASAGANPGPACYGAGGPLTITDVNLLLGKIDPSQFGIPVNIAHAQAALAQMQQNIFEQTGQSMDAAALLLGFEQIANEKMAEAIKRISVAKGFDPKHYPLLAFGGAGGLHACQLANILGIKTVILPYDGGLLSAYGMGQARAQHLLTQQVLQPYETFEANHAQAIKALKKAAKRQFLSTFGEKLGIAIGYEIWFYVRFRGQENALELPWQRGQTWAQLKTEFLQQYHQLFGYCPHNLPLEIESLKVLAAEQKKRVVKYQKPKKTRRIAPTHFSDVAPTYGVYHWQNLHEGDTVAGPAVLLNHTSTAFVPEGWQATCQSTRDLLVSPLVENEKPDSMLVGVSNPDPNNLGFLTREKQSQAIDLELFTNRFTAIAEEMGTQLQRTAFSVNVKERLDFSCALLDADAQLLVNAPHIPVHLGSLGVCARLVKEKLPVAPGDVVVTNHPKYGGSHLPDITLLMGVFTPEHQLIGYVINRAHHAEIGGKTPGSMPPDATTLAEEGAVIAPTYLAKNGQMQWQNIEQLLTSGAYPTRLLSHNLADLNAALASLKTGELALQQLVVQHGLSNVHFYMKRLQEATFEKLQTAMQPFDNQVFVAKEMLDDGHQIAVKITHQNQQTLFDFTGTSGRHPRNLNANVSIVYSTILYVLRLVIGQEIPLNEGLTRQVKLILPDDSLLHPHFSDDAAACPAVVGGNTEVSQRLTDTLLKAFKLAACSQGTMNNLLFGNAHFGYYETICGGTGAGAGFDGRSAVHQHMTNTRITDPEEMERRYPVRLNEFSVRANSGGRGQWQGGHGVVRDLTFLGNLRVTLITQHRHVPPYGLAGGQAGKTGQQTLTKTDGSVEKLAGICTFEVGPHDRLRLETPGGGGFGKDGVGETYRSSNTVN